MHTEISLATKFRFKLTLLNFWIKLTQKRYFRNKIMKITIEFWIFKLIYILNFSFNNFNSWGNPPPSPPSPPPKKKKYTSGQNQKKMNTTIEFFFIFKLVYVPYLSLNWQFLFFWPDLPKKIFPVENRKS